MRNKRVFMISVAAAVLLAACVVPLSAAPGDPAGDKAAKTDPKAAKTDPKADAKPKPPKDDAIVVTAVTGQAQQRLMSDAKAKWETVKVGDVLNNLTVIRTGFGSRVVLRLGDRGLVTIKSATKTGIREYSKRGNVVRMRLGLKYGSMRASVDSSRGANDLRVTTPVATLSVRGSGGGIGYWGDKQLGFYDDHGNWTADFGDGHTRESSPREWIGDRDQRSSDIQDQRDDPALDYSLGVTEEEASGDSSGAGGGFLPGGGDVTAGALMDVSTPEQVPGGAPPPIVPPDPPPPI